jgi:hypothetical protein
MKTIRVIRNKNPQETGANTDETRKAKALLAAPIIP